MSRGTRWNMSASRRGRTVARVVGVLLAASGAGLAITAPAQAVSVYCNAEGRFGTSQYGAAGENASFFMPTQAGLPQAATDCYMRQLSGGGYNHPVTTLQGAINACYTPQQLRLEGVTNGRLVVDGSFGNETRKAVRAVQRAEGIAIDGSFGNETRWHMLWPTTTAAGYTRCWSRY